MSSDYYTVVKGIRNGEERTHRIRSPNEGTAQFVREHFFERVRSTKSTAELMREHGWSELKVIGIEEVSE